MTEVSVKGKTTSFWVFKAKTQHLLKTCTAFAPCASCGKS